MGYFNEVLLEGWYMPKQLTNPKRETIFLSYLWNKWQNINIVTKL